MGGTTVQAPAPVDPAKVGADTLATQLRLAPDVYNAEAQYRPQYAALDQRILGDSLMGTNGAPGLLDLYGTASQRMGQQQIDANTQQREADIADVARLGGQARQAYLSANPQLARVMGGLEESVNSRRNYMPREVAPRWAGAGELGPASELTATGVSDSALTPGLTDHATRFADKTALQSELERQATEALQNGGKLSASELADTQQSVRGAFAARGLNDSNASIGSEILQTDAARTAKLAAARKFASETDATGQQTLNANRNFAAGVEDSLLSRGTFNANARNTAAATNAGAANQFALTRYGTNADLSRTNSALDLQSQLANVDSSRAAVNDQFTREMQLAGMLQGQAQDPFQMVLGRSGAVNQAQGATGQAGYTQNAGAKLFDPFNSSIMQIYAGNQANQLAANTATANNKSAAGGAAMGAVGTVAAAKIMFMCVPEGQTIDTPRGSMPIEKLRAGHEVIGFNGHPVKVLQKHEYAEQPTANRFLVLHLDVAGHGRLLKVCDRHRVQGTPAGQLQVGEHVGGRRITNILRFGGVQRSYDILTEDGGYQIHGVPVNTMIPEMAAAAAKLATSK